MKKDVKKSAEQMLDKARKSFDKGAATLLRPTLGHAVCEIIDRGESLSREALIATLERDVAQHRKKNSKGLNPLLPALEYALKYVREAEPKTAPPAR